MKRFKRNFIIFVFVLWIVIPFLSGILFPATNNFFLKTNWGLFMPKVFTADSFFTHSRFELTTDDGVVTVVEIPEDYKTFPVDSLPFSIRRAVWRIQELPGMSHDMAQRYFSIYACKENLFINNLPKGRKLISIQGSYYLTTHLNSKPFVISALCP